MSNEEGEEKKVQSQFHEPSDSVQNDPVYREAFMKESAKYIFDQKRIVYEHQQNHHQGFQSASMGIIKESASNAGKSLIILNGAAAIAVLANVGAEFVKVGAENIMNALLTYSWGAGTGALVFAGTYLSQHFFRHYHHKMGICFQIAAVSFFVIGFILFIFGGYFTAAALVGTGSPLLFVKEYVDWYVGHADEYTLSWLLGMLLAVGCWEAFPKFSKWICIVLIFALLVHALLYFFVYVVLFFPAVLENG